MPASLPPLPPVAARRPHVTEIHGETRVDDYHWLRHRHDPEVLAYLEAENAYTQAMMAPSRRLQGTLYREMLGRIKQTDMGVPVREGGWLYYSRTVAGRQYAIHCRRHGSMHAPEQVLLDGNRLARGRKFFALGAFEPSPDGRLLAFSTDFTGYREYTLRVKNLDSGRLLPLEVPRARSVAWSADGGTLFYVTEDDTKRASRLWRQPLDALGPELLFEEADARFSVSVELSRSRGFVFIHSHSATTSEVRFLPANRPSGVPVLALPRRQDHEYYLDHHGGYFYVVTNDRGRNFRLVRAPVERFEETLWEEVVPHREAVMLEGLDLFARHYVLHERRDGFPRLAVVRFADGERHDIGFPEPAYSVYAGANPEFDTDILRFGYESFVTPEAVYDYHMDTRARTLLKQQEVLGGYDPGQYESVLTSATAADGTAVPVSLVWRRDRRGDGPAPLLLSGYGAYGFPEMVTFSAARLSLLDRGVVFALAHVRGGGEMGKRWHDEGRMAHKMNTFTDFIACAEHLVDGGWTEPQRLVAEGGSAGGLLMGAVSNLRPDLFRAVVMEVPFVDVLNTMLDETLPLTTGEFEEWGNPKLPRDYARMRAWSPYDNLGARRYPLMLVETSLNDSQVMYWEPAKYVAKLRALKTDANPLLLRVNMDAGHGGASGRYDFLREIAFTWAFVLGAVGITG